MKSVIQEIFQRHFEAFRREHKLPVRVLRAAEAIAQCRNWLLANMPPERVKQISVAATTDAARAAACEKDAAALASLVRIESASPL